MPRSPLKPIEPQKRERARTNDTAEILAGRKRIAEMAADEYLKLARDAQRELAARVVVRR
jgi:hypothetical protein